MTVTARGLLFWPLRPVWRLVLRSVSVSDPWKRLNYRVPVQRYGPGSIHDFAWYFEGASGVATSSVDDIQDWLLGCEYISDPDLFRVADYWQHPRTFEQIKRGDCEDHAIWAWRKLVELGYDADLVEGRCLPWSPGRPDDRTHVWVMYRHDGQTFLLESTCKVKANMIKPLTDASRQYRPELGVDRNRKSFAFAGVLLTIREREFAR